MIHLGRADQAEIVFMQNDEADAPVLLLQPIGMVLIGEARHDAAVTSLAAWSQSPAGHRFRAVSRPVPPRDRRADTPDVMA